MSDLASRTGAMLATIDIESVGPRRIGRLAAYDGLMLEATGFREPVGSNARVIDAVERRAPPLPRCRGSRAVTSAGS